MQSNLGGCRFNHHQASRHRSESRPSIGSQSPNLYVLHSAYAYGNINKRLGRSNNFPSFLYSFFVPYIRHVRPPRFPGTHNAKRRKMKAGNTYNTHSITEKPPPVSKTRSVGHMQLPLHRFTLSLLEHILRKKPERVRKKTSAPHPIRNRL